MVYVEREERLSVGEETMSRLSRRGDLERFGPYQVVDSIATGGMAQIYKVRHEADPAAYFALKCIRPDCDDDPEFRRMLLDEARITGQLDHPNINRVIEVVWSEGRVALLLEHVEGIDLVGLKRRLRKRQEALPVTLVVHIIREVLAALDYAHRAADTDGGPMHVVHRDVSPGNVMVDVRGRVVLIDFGIARAQGRLAQTEVGSVKGKFRYMAPEQIKGAAVGASADIYAAGVLMWELLSGRRIHDDVAVAQMMMRVANAELPSLEAARSELPEGLNRIYAKATALMPHMRFASAGEFAAALGGVLSDYDPAECQDELARYALEGMGIDQRKSYAKAVARARDARERDLEGAILSALEEPDRIERLATLDFEQLRPVEANDAGDEPDDDEDVTEFDGTVGAGLGADPPTVPIVTLPEDGRLADSD